MRFIYSIHIIQVFSFVCVLTCSLLGVKKSLGHAQIGLILGFNAKFPMSIPTPFQMQSPPPARRVARQLEMRPSPLLHALVLTNLYC